MSRMKIILGLIAVFLIGVAVGGYGGYALIWKPNIGVNRLVARAFASQYSTMQFHEANYNEAKSALDSYLALLDEMSKVPDYWLDTKEIFVEQGFTYGQLAALNEKANRIDEANIYWSRAEQSMKLAGWKDISRKNIAERLEKLEKIWRGPIGDKNK